MKYAKEKILLLIFLIEIIVAIFVACFYYDLYNATVNGESYINEYGQAIFTPEESWSVSFQNTIENIF